MIRKAFILFALLAVQLSAAGCRLFIFSPAQPELTSTPEPTQAAAVISPTAVPQLTTAQLSNCRYDLPFLKKTVQFTGGKFESGSGADYVLAALGGAPAFGDLNGDGQNDAALILAENGGGSGTFESLVVMLNQNGAPLQSGSAALGDRVRVETLTIQNGTITVGMLVQGPNDPMCCPTLPVSQTYKWTKSGLKLTRVTSKTPDGAERKIEITSPAEGAVVADSVEVKGSVTIAPFENTLAYRLYDQAGNKITEGTIFVQVAEMGGPGSFDANIDLSAAKSETNFWLSVEDLSAADGTTLALNAVELKRP